MFQFNRYNPTSPITRAACGFIGILCVGVVVFYLFVNMQSFSIAADVVDSGTGGVVIRTDPENTFFALQNMVPGERQNAYLTVYNEGELDFSYTITSSLINGSQELFNVLDLKITGSEGRLIYTGKLKDLINITQGELISGKNENFCFLIGFPAECGLEYQNLNSYINFLINATESPVTLSVVWEPPLDESDVNTRHGGIMPVRFHLLNNGVYDTVKRGVDLVLTGVNAANQPVEYVFKVSDGTLLWQDTSPHPQYELPLLDTEIYPVKPDSYYTAAVMYGDINLGVTQFKSGH